MGLWMEPRVALLRLVDDPKAPVMARVRALQAVEHPPLALLRRLLTKPRKLFREKPVPSKLIAVATFKYKQEVALRQIRKERKARPARPNALGIV